MAQNKSSVYHKNGKIAIIKNNMLHLNTTIVKATFSGKTIKIFDLNIKLSKFCTLIHTYKQ